MPLGCTYSMTFPNTSGTRWRCEEDIVLEKNISSLIPIAFSYAAAAALCMLVCSLYVCAPLPNVK